MLMGIYLMKMFGYSLAVTVLAELAVVFLFLKFRGQAGCSRRAVALLVVLVNVLTNTPAVLICWLGRIYLPWAQIPLQIMVEGAVVAVEAYIYHSFENKLRWNMKHPVILSAAANLSSWLLGAALMALAGRITGTQLYRMLRILLRAA